MIEVEIVCNHPAIGLEPDFNDRLSHPKAHTFMSFASDITDIFPVLLFPHLLNGDDNNSSPSQSIKLE